jgi:hypothetical protein
MPTTLEDDWIPVAIEEACLSDAFVSISLAALTRLRGCVCEHRTRLIIHEGANKHDLCAYGNTRTQSNEFDGSTIVGIDVVIESVSHRKPKGGSLRGI